MPVPEPEEKKTCPECGEDLEGLDPVGHALSHWPESIPDRPEYKEARRRQKILMDMGKR